jgi:predicted amidohydrolase
MTDKKFRAGLVQMCTGRTIETNLRDATVLIRAAAKGGAHYIQTPEVTTQMERDRAKQMVETRTSAASRANSKSGCTSAPWPLLLAMANWPIARC